MSIVTSSSKNKCIPGQLYHHKYMYIRLISSFSMLLNISAKVFFIDLEETIFQANIFYDVLLSDQRSYYRNLLYKLCYKNYVVLKHITYHGKHFIRYLMESQIPVIIKNLQKNGSKVIALTSGYPSIEKYYKLTEFDIHFDSILCTCREPKGSYLIRYLDNNNYRISKNINPEFAFVDNHLSKLTNVRDAFINRYGTSQPIHLLHYQNKNNRTTNHISDSEFLTYWSEVINTYKILNP